MKLILKVFSRKLFFKICNIVFGGRDWCWGWYFGVFFVGFFFVFLGQKYISCFSVIFEETGNTVMVYKAASKITITTNKNNFPKLNFHFTLR